jgi:hypothetical protein
MPNLSESLIQKHVGQARSTLMHFHLITHLRYRSSYLHSLQIVRPFFSLVGEVLSLNLSILELSNTSYNNKASCEESALPKKRQCIIKVEKVCCTTYVNS